jgi:hypothetical protein
MHLEYQKLLQNDPGLELRLNALPGRLFSAKAHTKADTRAVFFCYALPAPPAQVKGKELQSAEEWTEEAGHTRSYLSDQFLSATLNRLQRRRRAKDYLNAILRGRGG